MDIGANRYGSDGDNVNLDEEHTPEWVMLGSELLEGSMEDDAWEECESLLASPGVDPALYMLFCSLRQVHSTSTPSGMWSVNEIRSLMRCAFMLGVYVRKSVEEVNKLW